MELGTLDTQYSLEALYSNLPEIYTSVYQRNELELDPNKQTFFIITGPTGAGKDTLFNILKDRNQISHVTTATTRKRRVEEGEDEGAYVWMRAMNEEKGQEENIRDLVKEYELLEWDFHYGNLYGLPEVSLEKEYPTPPVIRTDIKGTMTLKSKLEALGYQTVSILVVHDTWQGLIDDLEKRGDLNMEEILERIKEDVKNYDLFKQTDIVIHNSRAGGGLDRAVEGLRYVVGLFNKRD